MRDQFKLNFIDLPIDCAHIIAQLDHDLESVVQGDQAFESRRVWRKGIDIDDRLLNMLLQANADFYGFDLDGTIECNFARYEVGDHYQAQHMDCQTGYDNQRKVSFTLMLNDDYEGGEFGTQYEQVTTRAGRLIVFPSYLLHSVNPITQGTRYVIYGFLSGPDWR
jgi:predicted 2-oxoglutarate/Fe(II)-dependent dioxygenase YbiX